MCIHLKMFQSRLKKKLWGSVLMGKSCAALNALKVKHSASDYPFCSIQLLAALYWVALNTNNSSSISIWASSCTKQHCAVLTTYCLLTVLVPLDLVWFDFTVRITDFLITIKLLERLSPQSNRLNKEVSAGWGQPALKLYNCASVNVLTLTQVKSSLTLAWRITESNSSL